MSEGLAELVVQLCGFEIGIWLIWNSNLGFCPFEIWIWDFMPPPSTPLILNDQTEVVCTSSAMESSLGGVKGNFGFGIFLSFEIWIWDFATLWNLDLGFSGLWNLDFGYWNLNFGFEYLKFGFWIWVCLKIGFWISSRLTFGFGISWPPLTHPYHCISVITYRNHYLLNYTKTKMAYLVPIWWWLWSKPADFDA